MLVDVALHRSQHSILIKGFGDKVHRPHAHRFHCRAQAGIAGHDQHRHFLRLLDQVGSRCAGEPQIAEDQIEGRELVAALGFLHGPCLADLVAIALEQTAQFGAICFLVVNHEQVLHCGAHFGSG